MNTKIILGAAAGVLALTLAGGAVYASESYLGGAPSPAVAQQQPTTTTPATLGAKGQRQGRERLGDALLIKATADLTGQKPAEVLKALKGGQSLAQIAQSKGKTADDVIKAARATLADRLSKAVSAGKIQQARADQALAQFDANASTIVNDTALGGKLGQGRADRQGKGGRAALIHATAKVTGLTVKEIRQDLKAGQSLAQIAQSKGKTADDILAELRAEGQQRMDKVLARAKELINTPGLGKPSTTAAPTSGASQ